MKASLADPLAVGSGYNSGMTVATIGIRELRDGLSRHLAAVQEGDEIVVTDHGKPIARILPYGEESPLDGLIRLGVARPPRAPRAPLPEPIKADGTVSDLIKEQRR